MKFEVKDEGGRYSWRLVDDDGVTVRAIGPGRYKTKFDCVQAIKRVQASTNASIEGLKSERKEIDA